MITHEQAELDQTAAATATEAAGTQDQDFAQCLAYSRIFVIVPSKHHHALKSLIRSGTSKNTLKATTFEWMMVASAGAHVRA